MIIDGHSHVTLPVEEHIKQMDESGVDKTILFSTSFHPESARNSREVKDSMMFLNELLAGKKGPLVEIRKNSVKEVANVIEQHPDRYIGFGAVPTELNLDAVKQYVNEHIVKNHLAGIGEFTIGSGQISQMENIFKASLEFHHLPIWIHAFFPLNLQDIKDIGELARQYPQTPVILGHLGGCNWLETMDLVKEIPNLYLDTSAYYSTFILGIVINELPAKCIWGVDRPFGDIQLTKGAILKVAETPDVANAVLGENIARVLRL